MSVVGDRQCLSLEGSGFVNLLLSVFIEFINLGVGDRLLVLW